MKTPLLQFGFALLFAVVTRTATPAPTAPSGPPTIEELCRPALLNDARISPDGRYCVSLYGDEKDRHHLCITDLASNTSCYLKDNRDYDVVSFTWFDDTHVIIRVTEDRAYAHGLFILDCKDPDKNYALSRSISLLGIDRPRARPEDVLLYTASGAIELNTRRADLDRSPRRVYAGPKNVGDIVLWSSDFEGEPGYCITYLNGRFLLHRYHPKTMSWQEVPLDLDQFTVHAIDPDGVRLWVSHHDPARGYVLQAYNPDSGKWEDPVWADPAYDLSISKLYFSRVSRHLAGLSYFQRRLRNVWFEKAFGVAQATVDHDFPDQDNRLVSFDEQDRRFLFLGESDRQPDTYLLYDSAQSTLSHVAEAAPWLARRQLASSHPVSFRTRDGLRLEGYLTLPPNAAKNNPPPLVVLPHGGPWARTIWTFSDMVQFLASRGYAVLEPNYRGSAGYLPKVSHDDRYDFRRMCDDVTDATHALQHSGLIDPARVAIMGDGFGGYLALAGVAFEPGLYRCAVSYNGIFDWNDFVDTLYWTSDWTNYDFYYDFFRDKLTHDKNYRLELEKISPLAEVGRIHAPVLVGHDMLQGADNFSNAMRQSEHLVTLLQKAGVPHEALAHNLEASAYQDQLAYYHAVDAFLAKYLLPKTPAVAAAPAAAVAAH